MNIITARGFNPISNEPLHRVAKRKGWTPLYRGAYLDTGGEAIGNYPAEHLQAAKIIAAAASTPTGVFSGTSAAILHDLPLLLARVNDRVHVTRPHISRANQWVVTHQMKLEPVEVVEVSGVRCTSILRTLRDLANTLDLHELLAVADAAKARGVDLEPLTMIKRNSRKLRWMVKHASDRSESFAESWSRYLFIAFGFEMPILQPSLYGPDGQFLARPDFATAEGLLGEFDGKIKYDALTGPKKSAADVIMAEKRRENELRELGWEMARWDWKCLTNPRILEARWKSALERTSQLPPPRGELRVEPLKARPSRDWSGTFTFNGLRISSNAQVQHGS